MEHHLYDVPRQRRHVRELSKRPRLKADQGIAVLWFGADGQATHDHFRSATESHLHQSVR